MKKALFLSFILPACIVAVAQEDAQQKIKDSILNEGKMLYKSEMASWYGTDIFLEKIKGKEISSGGYFSYSDQQGNKCIFFSKSDTPVVLATILFDDSYDVKKARYDDQSRSFTSYEAAIYAIRKQAFDAINSDTLFKVYNNTSLNLIPIINGNDKKVYVLTGPKVNGVVVFGNDYLLTFDANNQLTGKKRLHKNIIPVNYSKEKEQVFGTMHSHLPETGDYITATDICTLMLYGKFAGWQQHIVISANYVSIWNCSSNQLATVPREVWDKQKQD
ncbi:MAG: hypothetical protein QM731_06250 [Chitinophagaceae bacterium]